MDDLVDCFGINAKKNVPKTWKYPIQFAYWVCMEYPEIRKEYNDLIKPD